MKSLSALMGDVPFISTALRGNNMTAKQTAPLVILNSTCKSAQCVRMCVFWGGGGVLVCFNRLFCTTTANCGKYEPHRWLTVYDECNPLEQHTHTHTRSKHTPLVTQIIHTLWPVPVHIFHYRAKQGLWRLAQLPVCHSLRQWALSLRCPQGRADPTAICLTSQFLLQSL